MSVKDDTWPAELREAVERIEPCCVSHPRRHYKSLPQAVGFCDDASL